MQVDFGAGLRHKEEVHLSLFPFIPDHTFETLDRWLSETAGSRGKRTVESILAEQLPMRVVKAVCHYYDHDTKHNQKETHTDLFRTGVGRMALRQLSRSSRRSLAKMLVQWPVPVIRSRGWNYAEVTGRGGATSGNQCIDDGIPQGTGALSCW